MNERESEHYRELLENAKRIDHLCDDFERAWLAGERPKVEAYLDRVAETERPDLLRELLQVELDAQLAKGVSPDRDQYVQRFPECASWIDRVLGAESASRGGETVTHMAESEQPAVAIEGFRILKELSRGGQAVVYQAIQLSTKRKVALKVLSEGPFLGKEKRRRFEREIELVGGLRHPGIVSIYVSGFSHGRCYYAMEYIRGETLTRHVQSRQLDLRDTLRLFARVCDAVDYAHQRGVIHRDLKPSNILVDDRGDPYVLDFGLAKIAGAEGGIESLVSLTGQIVGTPAYMSPEQAAGRPDDVDLRSDVYSLGVILYELLTGQPPYDVTGPLGDVLQAIQQAEPKRPSLTGTVVNSEVETIVLKTLDKEKERRYDTAGALRRDLQRYLDGQPIEAKRDSALYLLRKTLRRYRAAAAVAAMILVVVSVSTVALSVLYSREREARENASQEAERATLAVQREAAAREETSQLLYVSEVGSAADAWEDADLTRMFQLLDRHRPEMHQEGFHGFEWYLLWDKYLTAKRQIRLQHDGEVRGVQFTPDGETLITTTQHAVRFWDVQTRKVVANLEGDSSELRCVTLSPDGATIAVGHQSGRVILLDVATRQIRRELIGFKGGIAQLAFSPDKKTLVAAGFNRKKLWDVDSGELIHEDLGKPRFWALSATFLPDSQQLVVGSMGMVHIWQLAPPYRETQITHDRSDVHCVAVSPDGKLLVIAGDESVIRLHDLDESQQRMVLVGHLAPIRAGAFSPDGQLFASASNDRTVRLWEVATGEPIAVLRGHTANVISLAFTADGNTLASGSSDHTVILWDIRQPDPDRLKLHESPIQDLSISADGKTIATTSFKGHPSLALWDAKTGQRETLLASDHKAQVVAFSPVDNHTLVAGVGGSLQIWNLKTREYKDLPTPTPKPEVVALDFSPNGKRLASAARGTLNIWDTETWNLIQELDGPPWIHTDVAFSANGELLATPSPSNKVTLYDTRSWKPVSILDHDSQVTHVAFSPSGDRLAAVCFGGEIRIWDLTTLKKEFDLVGETSGLYCVAFSPDGKTLVTGGVDSRVNIWKLNLKKPELVASFRGHRSSIRRVEFTPDGKTLVTASKDGAVRRWRATTEDEIAATVVNRVTRSPRQ